MATGLPDITQSPFEKVTTICQVIDNNSLTSEPITLQAGQRSTKSKKTKRVFTPCKCVGPEILLQQMDPTKGRTVIIKK